MRGGGYLETLLESMEGHWVDADRTGEGTERESCGESAEAKRRGQREIPGGHVHVDRLLAGGRSVDAVATLPHAISVTGHARFR